MINTLVKRILSLILFAVLFLMTSCDNGLKKTNPFIFKKGSSSVEMRIADKKDYLVYDQLTEVMFIWNNIDIRTALVIGPGISFKDAQNDVTFYEFKVPASHVKNNTMLISLKFKIDDELVSTSFKVPMREKGK